MFLMCWWGSARSGCSCGSSSMGLLGLCVFGTLFWCVWCVGGGFAWFVVFSFFVVFFTSYCSGISVALALYD